MIGGKGNPFASRKYGAEGSPAEESSEPSDEAASEGDSMPNINDMAGKKAGIALQKALDSGDGAGIYAAIKQMVSLCQDEAG